MKVKNFHESSELGDPVVIQPKALRNEQKLTQVYLAERATEQYQAKLRWNSNDKGWHCYDYESGMWQRIGSEKIIALLMDTLSAMRLIEAQKIKVSGSIRGSAIKEIERAESSGFLNGTETLMRSMPELEIGADAFDADPYLVGLDNGQVLDLRTSSVRSIQQADYLTKRINSPHMASATCPLWEKSILEWSCGDKELARFLQVWCGYCMSGLTGFQGFLFLYGGGRNGKSVFLNVMSKLLGPYSIAMKSDTLMQKTFTGGASGDIARLNGVRFATCNELSEGKHFDEELLKMLTGQDTLTARFNYKDDFNFTPCLKLMICGNHQPVIKGTDAGIWRRVNLVPFIAKIAKVDSDLARKLNEEFAGILNWCIEGWKIYQQEGIVIPKAVTEATAQYRAEMDVIGQWLDEATTKKIGSKAVLKDLYQSYRDWCNENGFRAIPTSKGLNRKLKEGRLGEPLRCSAGGYYPDLKIKDGVEDSYYETYTPTSHRFDKD